MYFNSLLYTGVLIQRYKRFLADVRLSDGQVVTAHCANTGAMTGCAEPGWQVWLSKSSDTKRKLAYSWELVRNDQGHWICINTQHANSVVAEGLTNGLFTELRGYANIRREVRFGSENSRIDFLLSRQDSTGIQQECYVEVKSVTLLDQQHGYFPDAKTQRGSKHLRELCAIAQQGQRAVLLFCVQHSGIHSVKVAEHIDPVYAQTLRLAMASGVEVLACNTKISSEKIVINQAIPFIC